MTDIVLPPEPGIIFTIALFGEVDAARVTELHHLVEEFHEGCATDIVIDVSEVTFMDSTGLGFVARLYREAKDRGGSVTIRQPSDQVRRLLYMTAMEHMLIMDFGR